MQLLAEDAVLAEAVLRIPARSLCRRILTDTIVVSEVIASRSLFAAVEPIWS